MKTNTAGRNLIIEFEGIRLESYPDPESALARELRKPPAKRNPNWLCLPGKPWTIGIGATGPGIGPGLAWTEEQVWKRFERDVLEREQQVLKAVEVSLNENQFSALVAFVFNVGIKNLTEGGANGGPSRLLRKLNEGDYLEAAAEFPFWIYGGRPKRPVVGLRRRRLAEQALFLAPLKQVA